ncbi:MAG TPA: dihydrofolate reductase family protein [Puia sp.]|nr:dihydrofolate reductase family protein [Puia sp.]
MRKLIVSAWTTLDGVFDAGNMNQWYTPYDSVERQEYIRSGILAADAILFGRKTYEMLAPYWSSLKNNEMGVAAKLNSVPKFVVSSTLGKAEWNNSTIIKGNVVEEITRLKQLPGQEIQIEGSATLVESLMEAGLIDEYRFLVHPVIMGSGQRFFRDGMHSGGLRLVKTQAFDSGVILLCYKPQ